MVIVTKYRKRRLYIKFRKSIGQILNELCQQKRVELIEGALDAGPYPYESECASEVQHCLHNRIFAKQKNHTNLPRDSEGKWVAG